MHKSQENYDPVQLVESYLQPNPKEEENRENLGFLQNAPCGILTLTPKGSISSIKPLGVKLIGEWVDESAEPIFVGFVHPDYHGAMKQALQTTVVTVKPQTTELKMLHSQDQRELWLRADVCARLEPNGHRSVSGRYLWSTSRKHKKVHVD